MSYVKQSLVLVISVFILSVAGPSLASASTLSDEQSKALHSITSAIASMEEMLAKLEGQLAALKKQVVSTDLASVAFATSTSSDSKWVRGRILVAPKGGLSLGAFDKILKGHGGKRSSVIPGINVHIVNLPANADEHH